MNNEDLTRYGNLPRHIRERLATANQQPSGSETHLNDTEGLSVADNPVETASFSADTLTDTPPQSPVNEETHGESNEVKAWKGRIVKEQHDHKETRHRLLQETQARQQAEAEAQAAQARLAELQQRLTEGEANTQATSEKDGQKEGQAVGSPALFTDEEIDELTGFFIGSPAKEKFAAFLRQSTAPTPTTTAATTTAAAMSVEQVRQLIEQRLSQQKQEEQQQFKRQQWQQEIQTQIPEYQGLLTDEAFTQFLQEKVVDFRGNTALSLVQYAGEHQDVSLIPQLKALSDEFNRRKNPPSPQGQATAPPSHRGATIRPQTGKKKITPAVAQQIQSLKLQGKTDELRDIFDKYEY